MLSLTHLKKPGKALHKLEALWSYLHCPSKSTLHCLHLCPVGLIGWYSLPSSFMHIIIFKFQMYCKVIQTCVCIYIYIYMYICCFCLVTRSHPTLWPPWTVAHQAPLFMGFPRGEYWRGLPFPSPGDLPNPGIKPASSALQAESLPLSQHGNWLALLASWCCDAFLWESFSLLHVQSVTFQGLAQRPLPPYSGGGLSWST